MNERHPDDHEGPSQADGSIESGTMRTVSENESEQAGMSDSDAEREPGRSIGDWDNRILCGDENCIGVIGPDGRCKECGKPYEGNIKEAGSSDQFEVNAPDDFEEPDDNGEKEDRLQTDKDILSEADVLSEPVDTAPSDLEDYWKTRTLCSDESCIGVIGPDGRCKECGKPYRG